MRSISALLIAGVALAGCVTQSAPPQSVAPFSLAEAAFATKKGAATIKGQLFLKRNDGQVVYGAGSTIRLVPRTTHTSAAVQNSFRGSKIRLELEFVRAPALTFDPGVEQVTKTTRADGQGHFVFEGVAPGAYFIFGRVNWCAPSRYGCDPQGGELMETIELGPNDRATSVVLTM